MKNCRIENSIQPAYYNNSHICECFENVGHKDVKWQDGQRGRIGSF